MMYELREYHCVAGRLPDLIRRFEVHTLGIWKRLGIRPVGFFTTYVGPSGTSLTYLLQWRSLAERERIWQAFLTDPAWLDARKATESSGPLIDRLENRLLQPCVMVPIIPGEDL